MAVTARSRNTRPRRPEHLALPCGKSRKALSGFLSDRLAHRQYSWLTWNVKIHESGDISFDGLLKALKDYHGEGVMEETVGDPAWMKRARAHFEDEFDTEESQWNIWQWGRNDAAARLCGHTGSGIPDDECYNHLWDGTELRIEYGAGDGAARGADWGD